ncbi:MAG TPA: DNA-binding domain-containing protein [Chthoniobacterales bacterium]|nr:DNA-binding domain-containing protein [Chthoniobacterales bacterium]
MKPSKPTNSSAAKRPPRSQPDTAPALGLAELQRMMAEAVMRPLTAGEQMQPQWKDGRPTQEFVAGFIKPNDRLTSFDRLEIYNRQYWFRLIDCLYEDYPGLRAVLGDRRFFAMITAYLQRHPSESPLLRDLGRKLIPFLQDEPVWSHPHGPMAREMAQLEWAQIVAFDGESRRAATLKRLAGTPPDRVFLRLQPYITLLELTYPVDEIVIRLLRRDGKMRNEASNAVESTVRARRHSIANRVKPRPGWLLVHRLENSVYFKRLNEPQYVILRSLDRGASLEAAFTALEDLPSAEEISPQDVQSWFRSWAELGFLIPTST